MQDFESLSSAFPGMNLHSIFIAPMVDIIDRISDILVKAKGNLVTIVTTNSGKTEITIRSQSSSQLLKYLGYKENSQVKISCRGFSIKCAHHLVLMRASFNALKESDRSFYNSGKVESLIRSIDIYGEFEELLVTWKTRYGTAIAFEAAGMILQQQQQQQQQEQLETKWKLKQGLLLL